VPPLATDLDIDLFLDRNANWSRLGIFLRSEFTAPSFLAAIELVKSVAVIAERMDHHPDIDIRWNKVSFASSTHSAGGITSLDCELATAIDSVARELSGS
jgi:4a-hydroxytetrahydrobiopterin dehydratase